MIRHRCPSTAGWARSGELAGSEAALGALVANLPGMAYRCQQLHPDWPLSFASAGCRALTGYEPSAFTGPRAMAFGKLVHPEDRASRWDAVMTAVGQDRPFELTYRIVHRDGSARWAWERGVPQRGPDGRFTVVEGLICDITDAVAARARLEEAEHRYRALVEQSPDAVVVTQQGRITYANLAAAKLFGADLARLHEFNIIQFIDRRDWPLAFDTLERTEARLEAVGVRPYRALRTDGTALEVEATSSPVRLDGQWMTQTTVRDVTTRRLEERLLADQAKVLADIAANQPLERTLTAIAHMVEGLLPGSVASILLLEGRALRHGAAPSLPAAYQAAIDGLEIGLDAGSCGAAAHAAKPVVVGDIQRDPKWARWRDLAGAHGLAACWSTPVTDGAGMVLGTFAIYRRGPGMPDLQEWRIVQQFAALTAVAIEHARMWSQLQHEATHDPLTHLPNRGVAMDRLARALEQPASASAGVIVLFVDLDDFKLVNDAGGHRFGDEVLRQVSARLDARLGGLALLARFSGDEFVVVKEATAGPLDLEEQADELVAAVQAATSAPVEVGGDVVRVGASIGVATLEPSELASTTADELCARADQAMYCAKAAGRGMARRFDANLRAHRAAQARIEQLLQSEALHALEVHYQPIIALGSGRVVGAEALARLRDGEVALAPGKFIPVAESTGMICALGAEVLRRACRDLARWRAQREGLWVSVNVAPRQLGEPGFAEMVRANLAAAGLDPGGLVLEVTESAMVEDLATVREALESLRSDGLQVAVDDFGTGHSALAHLRRLPVDLLKIDRSFVENMESDHDNEAIVRAIVDLAEVLGLEVVAEGVETEAQRSLLEGVGVGMAQGFLWSRPVRAAEFEPFLREWPFAAR